MPYKDFLNKNLMGIEKENLRICTQGCISQEPHPLAFGSALTHPHITTDFSEALVEIVTPPVSGAKKALSFLSQTQNYLYHNLPNKQSFWPASMPCVIRGETNIPIAQYGNSNLGVMKTVYRQGLANRYGSVMQAIAGIHFNYSFAQEFLQKYKQLLGSNKNTREFNDDTYMGLTRNIIRYGWLIPYLFGASNAVCKSFLKGYHKHDLEELMPGTLYKPYATSLRMGDIGYQNLRGDKAGVKANYNTLNQYTASIQAGITTPCAEYAAIGLKKQGKYQQLSTNILQIENEYYSSVRPKPTIETNKKPIDALNSNGIRYIELRSLDINPLLPLGIDEQQIHFLEGFLLFCLLDNSSIITPQEQIEIDNNNNLTTQEGRKPNLQLTKNGAKILLQDWGVEIINKIQLYAKLLSPEHQSAIKNIAARLQNPELTPSATILQQMRNQQQGFFPYIHDLSKKHKTNFLSNEIDKQHFDYLDKQAQISLDKQQQIETTDTINFPQFLNNYFNN